MGLISVRLDNKMEAALKTLARENNTNVSEILRQIINEYMQGERPSAQQSPPQMSQIDLSSVECNISTISNNQKLLFQTQQKLYENEIINKNFILSFLEFLLRTILKANENTTSKWIDEICVMAHSKTDEELRR